MQRTVRPPMLPMTGVLEDCLYLSDDLARDHEVKVAVGPRLLLEERVDAPSTIDPGVRTSLDDHIQQLQHGLRTHHNRSVPGAEAIYLRSGTAADAIACSAPTWAVKAARPSRVSESQVRAVCRRSPW